MASSILSGPGTTDEELSLHDGFAFYPRLRQGCEWITRDKKRPERFSLRPVSRDGCPDIDEVIQVIFSST
jgi:hypothetical protein